MTIELKIVSPHGKECEYLTKLVSFMPPMEENDFYYPVDFFPNFQITYWMIENKNQNCAN